VSFEVFEHTADLGYRVRGATLEELFLSGAEALYDGAFHGAADRIGRRKEALSSSNIQTLTLEAKDLEELFRDWLGELLFFLEAREQMIGEAVFETLSETKLLCLFSSKAPPKNAERTEIKAVTYHELSAACSPEGWEARVLFDV